MKHIKLYEDFVNEATTSWKKMMQGVRSSETGPWSIVAIENKKVVGQKIDIRIQDMIPAHYEAMRKEFPRAKIHIEDGTGMVVWNESLDLNEGGGTLKVEKEKDGKYYWTFTFNSGKVEKWPNGFATSAEAQKDFMYRSKHLKEGTYNSKREIAIYDGPEGLTHIEKRGKGYYGYNNEFDFEATDKADLEKKLKSWKYKLISGSIDEAFVGPFVFNDTMSDEELKAMYDGALDGYANWQKGFQYLKSDYKKAYQEIEKILKKRGVKVDESEKLEEAVKIAPGMGAFYSYTTNHKLIEKIFKEAFKGQEDKLYRANFFNTGAPCIKFELKNQSSWMLVYYPGQTYLEDHALGSISLYPYGPMEDRYKIFKVGVKGNRRFGDTKMTPAEIKEAATEFKNWVNKQ